MQQKSVLAEAVAFFDEGRVLRQMRYAEFEALLDGVVCLGEYAGKRIQAAYLLLDARLYLRAAVFFLIDFDGEGRVDAGWNLPLRRLAEQGGAGPDLGAGPIRLSCGRLAEQGFGAQLWRPDAGDLALLQAALASNALGLMIEEAHAVAEPQGIYASAPLIDELRQQVERLQQALQVSNEDNARLRETLESRDAAFARQREELTRQLRLIEQRAAEEARVERETIEAQLAERLQRQSEDLRGELAAREMELTYHEELDTQNQAELQRLQQACDDSQRLAREALLQQLGELGVMLVAQAPGVGHLNLGWAQLEAYLAQPQAYAAEQAGVPLAQYQAWLAHYEQPCCSVCQAPLKRQPQPQAFRPGIDDRCAEHLQRSAS